ncbi:MAG TPA: hypothetical protein G4O00_03295 [Thermoflexia bacterium]|nr:hypothetical protein [Thermoflexia bacterium]
MNNRRWFLLILLAYLILGVIYSLATPPLEASDEFKHYPYTQYVQTHHDLPVLDPETCLATPDDCPWLQDGGQPPLYYILMAAVTSWIDTSDLPTLRWMNWHAFIGDPSQICNKNLVIHVPEREAFPWRGSVLAIHLIRLLTVGIGAGTVFLTYRLARDLFPDGPPGIVLGATALTAFNPMFLFVNSAVNNDALAAFLGCLSLLLTVRLVCDGLQGPLPLRRYGLVGLVVGLFLLTKLSGLAALILLALLLTWVSLHRRSLRPLLVGFPIIVGIAAGLSGWWFLRNWRLYGDPTALNVFVAIQGVRPGTPTLRDWWGEFGTFRWTYWGLFGAVDVMAPRWVYTFFDLLSVAGLVGLIRWAARRRPTLPDPSSLWWIPALWAGILFVSVLRWTWIYFSFQGRLVFPAIAGISTLLTVGLREWAPPHHRLKVTTGVSLALLLIAAAIPFAVIRPAYVLPEPIDPGDVPSEARVEPIDVGGGIRVVGWELPPQTVRTGENVEVVIYWEAVAPDGGDYVSFVRLLGRGMELAGDVNRRPACGMVPTSLWEPGQVWRDPYRVRVRSDAAAPTRLRIEAGLYDATRRETLGVVRLGEAKLAPPRQAPSPSYSLEVEFEEGIVLEGYDLSPSIAAPGDVVTLTLYWRAEGTPSRDYQVFVHLVGEDPQPAAQADGPPLNGDYPTGMWEAGETIVDPHPIPLPADLPPGEYRLRVGLYDLETMMRLARRDGGGDAVDISTPIQVR